MKFPRALNRLDDLIRSRSILNHPFYIAWQRGQLRRDQLAIYATVYYPHVASFPSYLESAAGLADDPVVRAELESNLSDEISNPKPHNELWLDFAEEFDLQRAEVIEASPHPAAQNIVSTFDRLTMNGAANGIAALYAYESQQPEVSRQKADGLRQWYGVNNPKSLAYFEVHAEADIEHRAGERLAIDRCLDGGASPEAILASADEALNAYWGLLDGICVEAKIPLNCN